MAEYGLLRSSTNTGLRSELIAIFTAPLSIISKKPNFSSETVTLKRRSVVTDIQRWEITAGIQPFEGASELLVHSVVNGYTDAFYARMPQPYIDSPIPDNLTPTSSQLYQAGIDALTFQSMNGEVLPVGSFIKFAGHSKVYMIKSTTLGGTLNHVTIFPKLTHAVGISEVVYYGSRVTIAVKYANDAQIGITYRDGILATIDSIGLIEAL